MNQLEAPQAFVRRFDAVRFRTFQVQLARGAVRLLLLALLGLAFLAGIDFLWEVSRSVRQAGLAAIVTAAVLLAAYSIRALFRECNRPRTAREIERRFPELGQSVRTAVQFGGRSAESVAAEGAHATLVAALEKQVDADTRPLPIEALVPTGHLKTAVASTLLVCAVLALVCVSSPEWNTAAHRVLLDERPYTQMEVTPGTTRIDLGQDVAIAIGLTGRTARKLTLFTRQLDAPAADWQEQVLSANHRTLAEQGRARYELHLAKIMAPFAYRISAGSLMSDEFQVGLRYPLRLNKVQVELTPPAYTGLEKTVVTDGNLHALEGTVASFRFELDRAPARAKVLLSAPPERPSDAGPEAQPPREPPVQIDGPILTMHLALTEEMVYSLAAEAADGMRLPATSYRIRIRQDQPPTVTFEQPVESLEVHPLAEVLMRIQARDDFGLSKAGIVFQVNNEEEHTLLKKDFEAPLEHAGKDAAGGKRAAATTRAALETLLPLEHFDLTQKDSITYYAFAEDNFPGGPRRTESDLRFIDIRPFKRTYRLLNSGTAGFGMGKPLPLLNELIGRQRFALNRSLQIARRAAQAGGARARSVDLSQVDQLITFQQQLAAMSRELADALRERDIAGNDLFFKAEESMLAAVDSLSAGKYDNAVLQERDALRYLIEGRDTVAFALTKQSPATRAELAAFQRGQLQKLRQFNRDQGAEAVASRLRQLAGQERSIAQALAGKSPAGEDQGPAARQSAATDAPTSPANQPKRPADSVKGAEPPANQPGAASEQPKADTDAETPEAGEKRALDRAEIAQSQTDAVGEAADIQRAMEKIQGLSELAKSRMAKGVQTAERAAAALDRDDATAAADDADKASRMFRELARNVEGLAAAETSQKLVTARNLADELSHLEREFAAAASRQTPRGADAEKRATADSRPAGTEAGRTAELGSRAEQIAEAGKTLEDILKGISRSTEPADREAARQVQDLLQQGKVSEAVKQLAAQAAAVRSGESRAAGAAASELADRFEATSQKLDALHRSIIAPRIANLMEVERAAVALQEKLDQLETQGQITDWHRAAGELLDELETLGAAKESRAKLREAMREAGWSPDRNSSGWDWPLRDERYGAPRSYGHAVSQLVADLHAIIGELILGDLPGAGDEQTPPQYERLVDRYYQVLSSDK